MDLFASEDGSRNNKCMTKNCSSWPSIELNASFQKFNDDDDDDTDCTSSSDDSGDTFYESNSSISTFKYQKWTTIGYKIQKIPVKIDINNAKKSLKKKMYILKYHLYIQNEQYRKYNEDMFHISFIFITVSF